MALTQLEQFLYQALCDAAFAFLATQPWQTLSDDDVFAVQNPDDKELHFVKITGREGEQCELSVFAGISGLDLLWFLSNAPDKAFVADLACDVRGLCFAALPKAMLETPDREIVAAITLPKSFDGNYPVFRSLRPGYFPAPLSISDLCLLTHVLRQASHLLLEVQNGERSLAAAAGHEDDYVARLVQKNDEGALAWRTDCVTLPLDELLPQPLPRWDDGVLAAIAAKPLGQRELRADLLLAPPDLQQAEADGAVPVSYVFLLSDFQSREPLCAQIATPGAALAEFRQALPALLLELLGRLPERPQRLRLELLSLQESLSELLAALGIALLQSALPAESAEEQRALLRQLAEAATTLPATLWF
jgi:hypothetical protein